MRFLGASVNPLTLERVTKGQTVGRDGLLDSTTWSYNSVLRLQNLTVRHANGFCRSHGRTSRTDTRSAEMSLERELVVGIGRSSHAIVLGDEWKMGGLDVRSGAMMALPAAEQTRHGQLIMSVFVPLRSLFASFLQTRHVSPGKPVSVPSLAVPLLVRLFLPSDRLPNERQRIIAVRGKFSSTDRPFARLSCQLLGRKSLGQGEAAAPRPGRDGRAQLTDTSAWPRH